MRSLKATRGERKARTKAQSVIIREHDVLGERFCTFNLAQGKGRGVGIVEDKDLTGKKTIRVSVVSFGARSMISHKLNMTITGQNIKRHIIKDGVKFFKPGIIPVSGY